MIQEKANKKKLRLHEKRIKELLKSKALANSDTKSFLKEQKNNFLDTELLNYEKRREDQLNEYNNKLNEINALNLEQQNKEKIKTREKNIKLYTNYHEFYSNKLISTQNKIKQNEENFHNNTNKKLINLWENRELENLKLQVDVPKQNDFIRQDNLGIFGANTDLKLQYYEIDEENNKKNISSSNNNESNTSSLDLTISNNNNDNKKIFNQRKLNLNEKKVHFSEDIVEEIIEEDYDENISAFQYDDIYPENDENSIFSNNLNDNDAFFQDKKHSNTQEIHNFNSDSTYIDYEKLNEKKMELLTLINKKQALKNSQFNDLKNLIFDIKHIKNMKELLVKEQQQINNELANLSIDQNYSYSTEEITSSNTLSQNIKDNLKEREKLKKNEDEVVPFSSPLPTESSNRPLTTQSQIQTHPNNINNINNFVLHKNITNEINSMHVYKQRLSANVVRIDELNSKLNSLYKKKNDFINDIKKNNAEIKNNKFYLLNHLEKMKNLNSLPVVIGKKLEDSSNFGLLGNPNQFLNAIKQSSKLEIIRDKSEELVKIHKNINQINKNLWVKNLNKENNKDDIEVLINRINTINNKLSANKVNMLKSNLIDSLKVFFVKYNYYRELKEGKITSNSILQDSTSNAPLLTPIHKKIVGILPWFKHQNYSKSSNIVPYVTSNVMGALTFEDTVLDNDKAEAYSNGVTLAQDCVTGHICGSILLPKDTIWTLSLTITRQNLKNIDIPTTDSNKLDSIIETSDVDVNLQNSMNDSQNLSSRTPTQKKSPQYEKLHDPTDFVKVQLGPNLNSLITINTYYNKPNPLTGTVLYDVPYTFRGKEFSFRFDFSSSSKDEAKHLAVCTGIYEEFEVEELEVYPDPKNPNRLRVLSSFVKMMRVEESSGLLRETRLLEELIAVENSTGEYWDTSILSHTKQRFNRDFFIRLLKAELLFNQENNKKMKEFKSKNKLLNNSNNNNESNSNNSNLLADIDFNKEFRLEESKKKYVLKKSLQQSKFINNSQMLVNKFIMLYDKKIDKWKNLYIENCILEWIDDGLKAKITHRVQEYDETYEKIGKSFLLNLVDYKYFISPLQELDFNTKIQLKERKLWQDEIKNIKNNCINKINEMKKIYDDNKNELLSNYEETREKVYDNFNATIDKKANEFCSLPQSKIAIESLVPNILLDMRKGILPIEKNVNKKVQALNYAFKKYKEEWIEHNRNKLEIKLLKIVETLYNNINNNYQILNQNIESIKKSSEKKINKFLNLLNEQNKEKKEQLLALVKFKPEDFNKLLPKNYHCEHLKTKAWSNLYSKGVRCVHCKKELNNIYNTESQILGYGTGGSRRLFYGVKRFEENEYNYTSIKLLRKKLLKNNENLILLNNKTNLLKNQPINNQDENNPDDIEDIEEDNNLVNNNNRIKKIIELNDELETSSRENSEDEKDNKGTQIDSKLDNNEPSTNSIKKKKKLNNMFDSNNTDDYNEENEIDSLENVLKEKRRLEKEAREIEETEVFFYDYEDLESIYQFDRRHAKAIKQHGIIRQGLQWTKTDLLQYETKKKFNYKSYLEENNMNLNLLEDYNPINDLKLENSLSTMRLNNKKHYIQYQEFLLNLTRINNFKLKIYQFKVIQYNLAIEKKNLTSSLNNLYKISKNFSNELNSIETNLYKCDNIINLNKKLNNVLHYNKLNKNITLKLLKKNNLLLLPISNNIKKYNNKLFLLNYNIKNLIKKKVLLEDNINVIKNILVNKYNLYNKYIKINKNFSNILNKLNYCMPGNFVNTKLFGIVSIISYRIKDDMILISLPFGPTNLFKAYLKLDEVIAYEKSLQLNELKLMENEDLLVKNLNMNEKLIKKNEIYLMSKEEILTRNYNLVNNYNNSNLLNYNNLITNHINEYYQITNTRKFNLILNNMIKKKLASIIADKNKRYNEYIGPLDQRPKKFSYFDIYKTKKSLKNELKLKFITDLVTNTEKNYNNLLIKKKSEYFLTQICLGIIDDVISEMISELVIEAFHEGKAAKLIAEKKSGIYISYNNISNNKNWLSSNLTLNMIDLNINQHCYDYSRVYNIKNNLDDSSKIIEKLESDVKKDDDRENLNGEKNNNNNNNSEINPDDDAQFNNLLKETSDIINDTNDSNTSNNNDTSINDPSIPTINVLPDSTTLPTSSINYSLFSSQFSNQDNYNNELQYGVYNSLATLWQLRKEYLKHEIDLNHGTVQTIISSALKSVSDALINGDKIDEANLQIVTFYRSINHNDLNIENAYNNFETSINGSSKNSKLNEEDIAITAEEKNKKLLEQKEKRLKKKLELKRQKQMNLNMYKEEMDMRNFLNWELKETLRERRNMNIEDRYAFNLRKEEARLKKEHEELLKATSANANSITGLNLNALSSDFIAKRDKQLSYDHRVQEIKGLGLEKRKRLEEIHLMSIEDDLSKKLREITNIEIQKMKYLKEFGLKEDVNLSSIDFLDPNNINRGVTGGSDYNLVELELLLDVKPFDIPEWMTVPPYFDEWPMGRQNRYIKRMIIVHYKTLAIEKNIDKNNKKLNKLYLKNYSEWLKKKKIVSYYTNLSEYLLLNTQENFNESMKSFYNVKSNLKKLNDYIIKLNKLKLKLTTKLNQYNTKQKYFTNIINENKILLNIYNKRLKNRNKLKRIIKNSLQYIDTNFLYDNFYQRYSIKLLKKKLYSNYFNNIILNIINSSEIIIKEKHLIQNNYQMSINKKNLAIKMKGLNQLTKEIKCNEYLRMKRSYLNTFLFGKSRYNLLYNKFFNWKRYYLWNKGNKNIYNIKYSIIKRQFDIDYMFKKQLLTPKQNNQMFLYDNVSLNSLTKKDKKKKLPIQNKEFNIVETINSINNNLPIKNNREDEEEYEEDDDEFVRDEDDEEYINDRENKYKELMKLKSTKQSSKDEDEDDIYNDEKYINGDRQILLSSNSLPTSRNFDRKNKERSISEDLVQNNNSEAFDEFKELNDLEIQLDAGDRGMLTLNSDEDFKKLKKELKDEGLNDSELENELNSLEEVRESEEDDDDKLINVSSLLTSKQTLITNFKEQSLICSICKQSYLPSQNNYLSCCYHSSNFFLSCPASCPSPGLTKDCMKHRVRRWLCCNKLEWNAPGCCYQYHLPIDMVSSKDEKEKRQEDEDKMIDNLYRMSVSGGQLNEINDKKKLKNSKNSLLHISEKILKDNEKKLEKLNSDYNRIKNNPEFNYKQKLHETRTKKLSQIEEEMKRLRDTVKQYDNLKFH